MEYNIAVVAGDGIGVDITESALKVLDSIGKKYNHCFNYQHVIAGGVSIDKYGVPLTEQALEICKNSDSVILGAVGGAKWDTLEGSLRPERALLGIRKGLGLFANIRPVKLFPVLKNASPLKNEIIDKGFDIIIVRELTGGMYFGDRGRRHGDNGVEAYDTECYSEMEIERIARVAFDLAMTRGKNLISIDKANVLESSRLWREVVSRVGKDYPAVQLSNMLVDNAAMQLIRNPSQFDVVLTSNMFGDILSDEASQLTGSIGLLPSASLGDTKCGMYEPIHGSAPDIAGLNIANPIATILSVAMMLRLSFGLTAEADCIENAVNAALNNGYRTKDIMDTNGTPVGTDEITNIIISHIVK